jgi:Lon protease-like protein
MNDLIPLAQAHCAPCKGSEYKLTQARLAELLPLDERQRLALLQQNDPHERLEQLLGWIP